MCREEPSARNRGTAMADDCGRERFGQAQSFICEIIYNIIYCEIGYNIEQEQTKCQLHVPSSDNINVGRHGTHEWNIYLTDLAFAANDPH